ncbi:MAG: IS4 family transposase [Chloroflexaceae bacterium]
MGPPSRGGPGAGPCDRAYLYPERLRDDKKWYDRRQAGAEQGRCNMERTMTHDDGHTRQFGRRGVPGRRPGRRAPNGTTHPATTGPGPITTAASRHQGLLGPTPRAISPDRVPLGLLQHHVWARDAPTVGPQDHQPRPIADTERQQWLTTLEAGCTARTACPATQVVRVGDRKADGDDRFVVARPVGVALLVQAAQDRKTDGPDGARWAAMVSAPIVATVTLALQARGDQVAREASVTVSWREVTLRPPHSRVKDRLPHVTVWAIERTPPAGAKPAAWRLLTTLPITTTDAALERLTWSSLRWGTEVWHTVHTSGCRMGPIHLETADRLIRCLTWESVIAWRIFSAMMRHDAGPRRARCPLSRPAGRCRVAAGVRAPPSGGTGPSHPAIPGAGRALNRQTGWLPGTYR